MNKALVFSVGSSANNINILAVAAICFENNSYDLKGFRKGNNLRQLLTDYILKFNLNGYEKISIILRSSQVAKFFKQKNYETIPEQIKIRSLDTIDNFVYDEQSMYSVLIESLSCQYLNIEQLSKTDKEILERSIKDIGDVVTQALIVGTASPPKMYNF
jgi:hypothetical protein